MVAYFAQKSKKEGVPLFSWITNKVLPKNFYFGFFFRIHRIPPIPAERARSATMKRGFPDCWDSFTETFATCPMVLFVPFSLWVGAFCGRVADVAVAGSVFSADGALGTAVLTVSSRGESVTGAGVVSFSGVLVRA